MKATLLFLLLITGVLAASRGFCQTSRGGFTLEAGYSVSAPLGNLKENFTNNTSFRGFRGELAYAFNRTFSLGLHSGFQNYYQRFARQLHKLSNTQSVSAVLTNAMQITPIMLNATYSPLGEKQPAVQPYVSIGAGIGLVNTQQYLGAFGISNESANFAAKGGVGVKVPLGKGMRAWGVKAGADYTYCNYDEMEMENLTMVSGHVSVYYELK